VVPERTFVARARYLRPFWRECWVCHPYFILRLLYDNIITIKLYVMYASSVKDFPIPGEAWE
jgi:hypothetical protein